MDQPLVSVVIPFYSEKKWLLEALDSIQNQTYRNIEVLIINDGSSEDLSDITDKYNMNISVIHKENGGPASARNMGIELSSGKYIAFLDSDDIWLPTKLEKQIKLMEEERYVWCQHSYEMFWNNKDRRKIINTSIYSGDVYKKCFISFKVQTSCVVVLRKILIDENIRFPVDIRYGEDMDFYRKIAYKYPLGYVDAILGKFRIRGENAGFKARIQIMDKAHTWKSIISSSHIFAMLPRSVLYAYKLSYFGDLCISALESKIKNNKIIEIISKFFYSIPFVIFKINALKCNG